MAEVKLLEVSKRYGEFAAVTGMTLTVADGQFVTLLGPSGCGKTTVLRMVAGFLAPTSGQVWIGDRLASDPARRVLVPPNERHIGMVFQSYAVWPHMTVHDNVAYPLKIQRVPQDERRRRVAEVLGLVQLSGLERRYPHQLSGGQQQRVALARALVMQPDVLLLDEPLSNLDAKLREEMRDELKELQRQVGATVLFVTHDQSEAMALSDVVVVMEGGVVQQIGTPTELYERPDNRFVASFVGTANLLPAHLSVAGGAVEVDGLPGVCAPLDGTATRQPAPGWSVLVRPEAVELEHLPHPPNPRSTAPLGRVRRVTFSGSARDYVVGLEGPGDGLPELRAHLPAGAPVFEVGDQVGVRLTRCRAVPDTSIRED